MVGPSTDAKAVVCAQLTQAYVAGNAGKTPFSTEDLLNVYNEFIGMLEEQHASEAGSQFNMRKLID